MIIFITMVTTIIGWQHHSLQEKQSQTQLSDIKTVTVLGHKITMVYLNLLILQKATVKINFSVFGSVSKGISLA